METDSKLEPKRNRKAVVEHVNKMRKLKAEVFWHLDPSIITISELLTSMRKRGIIDEVYYAKLKKTQDNVSS